MKIRPATLADLTAINDIYNHYVLHSTCTYQTVPSTAEERLAWFTQRTDKHPVRVLEDAAGTVVGWHSLTPFKTREAYARTVENSIYLRHDLLGKGLGSRMLDDQLAAAAGLGHRVVLAVICSSQLPSLRLHEKFGFTPAGLLQQVGYKFDRWLDIAILQKLI
jgi:phosphinothricin acetyltransferase